MSSAKIHRIPLSISLALGLSFLTSCSVSKQVVDKFYGKNFDLRQIFELWNIDMLPLCDIQEYSVDEEEEGFYV